MKEDLYELESLTAGSQEFDDLISKIMASLHHHNDSEEIKDLPLLEPAIGREASIEAAADFKTTKKFVPTRSVFSFAFNESWLKEFLI